MIFKLWKETLIFLFSPMQLNLENFIDWDVFMGSTPIPNWSATYILFLNKTDLEKVTNNNLLDKKLICHCSTTWNILKWCITFTCITLFVVMSPRMYRFYGMFGIVLSLICVVWKVVSWTYKEVFARRWQSHTVIWRK